MKKIFSYIFKDWRILDYVVCAISLLLAVAIFVVSKTVKKPVEVKEIFSAVQVVSALFLVWGIVFCSKGTTHGFVIGIFTIAFFSYGLFVAGCFGSFIVAMLMCAYLIFKLILALLKKDFDFGRFEKWDFAFLFGGLAVCAYPAYMLMDILLASCVESEMLILLCGVAFLYLQFKKVEYSKILTVLMSILTLTSLVILLAQLRLETAGLAAGVLVIVVYLFCLCVKMFLKKKEIKRD